jgi:hypothetical protein
LVALSKQKEKEKRNREMVGRMGDVIKYTFLYF